MKKKIVTFAYILQRATYTLSYLATYQMINPQWGGKKLPAIKHFLRLSLRSICTPIRKEPIFFILIFLLLSPSPLTSIVIHFGEISCARGTLTGLCGGLAWSYLFTLIVCLPRQRSIRIILKCISYFIAALLALTYFTLRYGFGKFITPAELSIIISTTPTEAYNFFATYLSLSILIWLIPAVLLVSLIVIYSTKIRIWLPRFFNRIPESCKLVLEFIFALSLLFGFYDLHYVAKLFFYDGIEQVERWPYWRIDDHYGDNLSKLIYSSTAVRLSEAKIKLWDNVNRDAYKSQISSSADTNLKIVLIIGESFIRSHSSLYGYPIETNPRLQAEADSGRLVTFTDAVSISNSTIDAIRNILCTNDNRRNEMWYDSPYFPILFAKAGWEVNYWDNQTARKGDWSIFNFTMTEFLFNDFLMEKCYTHIYEKPYPHDGGIVSDYAENVAPTENNTLAIFHLFGQHFNAAWRYPNDSIFSVFDGNEIPRSEPWMDNDKRQAIAHYDNATYYNDFVVSSIIDIFKDDNATVVYFSDHGEEIYDYRDSQGRKACPENIKAQLIAQNSVPFFVWMSDEFQRKQPSLARAIIKSSGKPILTQDISHFIMGAAQLNTHYYIPERNFSSDRYESAPRIIMDNLNYDEITK